MADKEYTRPAEEFAQPGENISTAREFRRPPREDVFFGQPESSSSEEPESSGRAPREALAQKKKERKRLLKNMVRLAASAAVAVVTVNAADPQVAQTAPTEPPAQVTEEKKTVFQLYRDASYEGDNLVCLAPGEPEQAGLAWSRESYDISKGLTLEFDFYIASETEPDRCYGNADGFRLLLSTEEPDPERTYSYIAIDSDGVFTGVALSTASYMTTNYLQVFGSGENGYSAHPDGGLADAWHRLTYTYESGGAVTIALDGVDVNAIALGDDYGWLSNAKVVDRCPIGNEEAVWIGLIASTQNMRWSDHYVSNFKVNGQTVTYEGGQSPRGEKPPAAAPADKGQTELSETAQILVQEGTWQLADGTGAVHFDEDGGWWFNGEHFGLMEWSVNSDGSVHYSGIGAYELADTIESSGTVSTARNIRTAACVGEVTLEASGGKYVLTMDNPLGMGATEYRAGGEISADASYVEALYGTEPRELLRNSAWVRSAVQPDNGASLYEKWQYDHLVCGENDCALDFTIFRYDDAAAQLSIRKNMDYNGDKGNRALILLDPPFEIEYQYNGATLGMRTEQPNLFCLAVLAKDGPKAAIATFNDNAEVGTNYELLDRVENR